jgi:hypothetical protein
MKVSWSIFEKIKVMKLSLSKDSRIKHKKENEKWNEEKKLKRRIIGRLVVPDTPSPFWP